MSYKVIKIVNEYLIVVDYGQNSNANEGDLLEIFQVGEEVFDHENSNISYGTLDLIKGRIRVMNVYGRMSLCKSAETTVIESHYLSNIGRLMAKTFNNYEIKALNVNTKQISGGYSEEEDLVINVGDPVRVIKSKSIDLIGEEEASNNDSD